VDVGILTTEPALRRRDLLAPSVAAALETWDAGVSANARPLRLPTEWSWEALRRSKIWLPGPALAQLPNATVLASLGRAS
jgi:hypothetical protein